jgi:chemotaxis response regulator CheB
VFEALRAGAIDVVGTPTITPEKRRGGAAMLLAKIDTVSRLVGGDAGREPARQSDRNNLRPGIVPPRCLVVIGASAGGPAALATILGGLSHDFPAAVVVIQHMDAQFAPLMVSWLNDQSPLSVRMARDGDQLQVGAALVASTNDHLVFVNAHTLGYTPEPRDAVYRPSIDVFCDSVIRHWRGKVVGILLTGMGRDGATGLKALRNTGAMTIAQDRTSCVVYGMPKAAAELDAAVAILPLDRIASDLNTLFP